MNQAEADRYRRALEDSVPFKGLPAPALEQIMERGLLLEAKKDGVVLFEHMRGGLGLYVVLHGDVEIFHSDGSSETPVSSGTHLNSLGRGECFGEYSLIDGKTTSASARAVNDAKLFFLPGGEFSRTIEGDPLAAKVIFRNLLLLLVTRLRQKM